MSYAARNSSQGGYRINSERRGPLTPEQHAQIRRMIARGTPTLETALSVGCSSKTVQRIRKDLKS